MGDLMSFFNALGKVGKAAFDMTVSAGEKANSTMQEAKALAPEMEGKSDEALKDIIRTRSGAIKLAAGKELKNRGY